MLNVFGIVHHLSMFHYNQPTLVEDFDCFCTVMAHNTTGFIFYQHSEGTLLSMTHVLFIKKIKRNTCINTISFSN